MRITKSMGAGVIVAALAGVSGCGHTTSKAPPLENAAKAVAPPLGAPKPAPEVKGLTVLVVGDSWARNLGVGMANVGKGRGYTVVNAAQGGCGIMLPTKEAPDGRLAATRPACRTWPEQWPQLVARYRPQAVVLYTAYWDQTPQVIDGGRPRDLGDPIFRRRYQANMDRAIGLLRAHGAAVYVGTAVIGKGAQGRAAQEMNREVETVVQRNSWRDVHLLDVRRQLCVHGNCPARIRGIDVYDETGHPTAPAHDRLGNWILTTLWTAVGHGTR